jgi:AraC-like DNA-binding protein
MLKFYKKAAAILVGLIVFTLLAGYVCIDRAFLHGELLPAQKSVFTWHSELGSDVEDGGLSTITLNDNRFSLNFDFNIIVGKFEYPYVSAALVFGDQNGKQDLVDLSQYNSISFSVKCTPGNVLWFGMHTVDEHITKLDDLLTYRTPSKYFSCDENWSDVEIDITHLETPQWWLDTFNLELSMPQYQLHKVQRIDFGNTYQSPFGVDSNVQINELTLHGRDWRYMYAFSILMLFVWGGFAFWFFRQHTKSLIRELKDKLQKDRPLVAYQQLSIEPKKDTDKKLILSFLVTEYANADLSLETMAMKLGVSRTKINDILKEELGYTFTAYLNKLRLTESARLLSEKDEANVAEIAYSVGYKNVSYFNKLFKNEYGCTPKIFRHIYNNK